jgi:pimeloyl-ACP methyl ester carboxylesterase
VQLDLGWSEWTIRTSDGIELAVFEIGPPRPQATVLLVHGYPDDHHVWDSVAVQLVGRFRVISYDVRGAGRSDHPQLRNAYRLGQLAADLVAVTEASAEGPVHVVGHDWGSIQSWVAVAGTEGPKHFASFTSISGPDLSYAAAWMVQAARRFRLAGARQLLASSYIGWFQVPVLPDLFWRSGLGIAALGRMPSASSRADAVAGLNLYRANSTFALTRRPVECFIPVLVLAPAADSAVSRELAHEAPRPWVTDLTTQTIEGGHWTMIDHPERVSLPILAFLGEHA